MENLRAGMDDVGGGPAPFSKADRSGFLQALDRVLVKFGQGWDVARQNGANEGYPFTCHKDGDLDSLARPRACK